MNGYGEPEKYGNGLWDIAYALDRYDYFKQQYDAEGEETAAVLEENDKEVLCFEETGCVEGSWSKDNHYGMPVLSGYNNVKKGARYPDLGQYTEKMTLNPWWHGYWQKKLGDTRQYTVNYVASYIYITRLANKEKYGGNVATQSGLTATVVNNIVSDVNSINWASGDALGKRNPTAGEKRAFIWGMAMHTLADTFAHSAYRNVNGSYHAITHTGKYPGADDTNTVEKRFEDAKEAVGLALKKYTASNHPNGTYAEFSPVKYENKKMENYKLGNIQRYVEDVSDVASARSFSLCNHNISGT